MFHPLNGFKQGHEFQLQPILEEERVSSGDEKDNPKQVGQSENEKQIAILKELLRRAADMAHFDHFNAIFGNMIRRGGGLLQPILFLDPDEDASEIESLENLFYKAIASEAIQDRKALFDFIQSEIHHGNGLNLRFLGHLTYLSIIKKHWRLLPHFVEQIFELNGKEKERQKNAIRRAAFLGHFDEMSQIIQTYPGPFYTVTLVDDPFAPYGKSFALENFSGEDIAFNAALESGRLRANFFHILRMAFKSR